MKISKLDIENLEKIKDAVKRLEDIQSELCDIAEFITGEKDGWTFDYVFNDVNLEEFLEKL